MCRLYSLLAMNAGPKMRRSAMVLVLVLESCAHSPSLAQIQAAQYVAASTPAPAFQASPAIISQPGYLEMNAYVSNQAGNPILGLKQADFVADASGLPVPIKFFRENAPTPATIGILIDTSRSMKAKLDTVELMLGQFINGLNSSDEIFLITFNTKPDLQQPLTTNRSAVVQSLSNLQAIGETSIYDAIVLATGESRKGRYASKVILLITDGVDNTSTVKEQDAVAALKATGVIIYSIGIGDPNISEHRPGIALGPFIIGGTLDRVDSKALQGMAHDAGGQAFIVPPMDKDAGNGFARAIKSISAMLGNSYTIGVALSPGTSASTLQLNVANHPNAIITTRIVGPPLPG